MFKKNLNEVRLRLVPDEVSETEFWRNYFYHIELWKLGEGFENRLGERIDTVEREAAIDEEVRRTELEIKRLQQESSEQLASDKVAVEEGESQSSVNESTEQSLAGTGADQTSEVELQEI